MIIIIFKQYFKRVDPNTKFQRIDDYKIKIGLTRDDICMNDNSIQNIVVNLIYN